MRTTIRLDDNLLKDAKKAALESNMSLTSLIEVALKEKLYRQEQLGPLKPVKLKTFKGAGLQPGVDLDDTRSLLDIMED